MMAESRDQAVTWIPWTVVPDDLLLKIFRFLPPTSLLLAAQVCSWWLRVSRDEILWRERFTSHYGISRQVELASGKSSWRREFLRLYSRDLESGHMRETRCAPSHADEAWYVTFSEDGAMFASCGKDGFLKVWTYGDSPELTHSVDMSRLHWQHVSCCSFNSTGERLLVAGISQQSRGRIAVMQLQGDSVTVTYAERNTPFDIFSCWYDDNSFVNGSLEWSHHGDCTSYIYRNQINTGGISPQLEITRRNHAGYIRTVLVANCRVSSNLPQRHNVPKRESTESNLPRHNVPKDESIETNIPQRHNVLKRESAGNMAISDVAQHFIFTQGADLFMPHQLVVQRRWRYTDGSRVHCQGEFEDTEEVFDTHSRILGISLSRDHRYLMVNSRRWVRAVSEEEREAGDSPPISDDITLHVIDLTNPKITFPDQGFTGHKASTNVDDAFIIYGDMSQDYLASGGEDGYVRIWDRHYKVEVAKLEHKEGKCVNSVSFHPHDQNVLLSACDDCSIMIWRWRQNKCCRDSADSRSQHTQAPRLYMSTELDIHLPV